MIIKVKVFEVSRSPSGGHSLKGLGTVEVEGRNDDELRKNARLLLKARDVRSVSRGPRGLVVYLNPRSLKR